MRGVLDHGARLQRRQRAHRVEVLLAGAGRDRARAGRVREHLALVDQRGGGVLGDHQARARGPAAASGTAAARRSRGRAARRCGARRTTPARTARARGGRAAATAAGRGSCRRRGSSPSSGNTSGLSVTASSSRSIARRDVVERVGRRRRAPAARSAACTGPARGRSRRGWPPPGCRRAARAAARRPRPGRAGARSVVQARVERHGRALERLERERHGHDRGVEQPPRVAHRERAGGRHQVRAVDDRQALLGGQLDRLEAGARAAPRRRAARRRRTSPRPRRSARARGGRAARGRPTSRPSPCSGSPA